jgi:GNAT superfamily N-acetyltransferase
MGLRLTVAGEDLDGVHRDDKLWLGSDLFWRFQTALERDHPAYSWCFEDDGQPVGHGAVDCQAVRLVDQCAGFLWVAPDARRHGAGNALRSVIQETAARHGFRTVLMGVPEWDPHGRAVAGHWGAVLDGHHFESTLDLTAVTDDQVAAWTAKATGAGVTLHQVDDDAELADLYPFARDRFKEAPDSGEASDELTLEVFRAVAEPANMLVARRGADLVGMTWVIHRPGQPPATNTAFTGVHPDARGHGIALALKAEQARQLRDQGYHTLFTQNMAGNEPILRANQRMGFTPGPGWFDYVLATQDQGPTSATTN